jgi:hypothetical protein
MSQEYFEPGVNTKLNRRTKPKTNFMLPSDMPTFPLGVVPTNQTPGANGEEPAIVAVRESQPDNLRAVFARIQAEERAEQPRIAEDVGSVVARQFGESVRERALEKKVDSMIRQGFTEGETQAALQTVRAEEAVKEAKLPSKPIPVEEAIQEALGLVPRQSARGSQASVATAEGGTQTDITVEGGKVLVARRPRGTAEEVAARRAAAESGQPSIEKFFPKK